MNTEKQIATNDRAYPFKYCINGGSYEWRVWRPDRVPHHHGHFTTEDRALRIANKINRRLGLPLAQKEETCE